VRLTAEQQKKRERLAAQILLDNVDVSPVRKSRLVVIAYTSRSPNLSARIANTWAEQYIAETMARQFASTADARKFLEDRLGTLRVKLEQSERDLVGYASRNKIVPLTVQRDAEGKTMAERTLAAINVETLSQALNGAIADRIAAESRLIGGGQNTSEALASPTIGQMRQKRAELAGEYANLTVQFTDDYPPARALKEEVAALDAAIARESGRFAAGRQQAYQEALSRERNLRGQLDVEMAKLDTQERASIQYNIYQREVDTNRQLYDALLQRYKEIGVAGLVGANNISIIDQADVPQKASSPKLFKNLFVALALGLALAAATALALDHIDEGIRIPADVARQIDLPLLGYVPEQNDDPLEVVRDMKSAFIESYFSIRSNLAFTTAHGLPRSMMVTSTRAGEGKSMTSLALAVVIGVTGKRVLLIDADMRSPSVHEYTAGDNSQGLSNLLAGATDYQSMIAGTSFKGVSVLPAGPHPPSAAELLSNDRLRKITGELLKGFDHIIFDSPPVLGLTDAPILAGAVEGCIYVIEAEGVPVRGIRASINRLRQVNAQILGVVLTKLSTSASGYGYGYGYGYEYGSAPNKTKPADV
jgi:capsular exopolysaccharide synthesis family protein